MTAKRLLFMMTCVLSACGAPTSVGWAGPPEELGAFVQKAAADLSSSPLKVAQFHSAKMDTAEDLGKADGFDRYLCWLKSDQGRVGYIATANRGDSYHVVAFSATVSSPQYFFMHLRVAEPPQKSVDSARVYRLSSVANVPLVVARGTFLGAQPFEISELAASLSSVLNYWQSDKKILLFSHVGFELPVPDAEYSRRFMEDPASAREPEDPNWQSFRKERQAVLAQVSIPEGRTSEEKAAGRARAHDICKPLIRRRLLDPINARERMDVLEAERADFDGVVRVDISLRMRDAILLQRDYLDPDPGNLQRDIELFFKTRGRRVRVEAQLFEMMRMDALPAIIMKPPDLAAVVLGYTDIGGERFASVFFPKTGLPVTKNRAQKLREIRSANGLPPEPNWTERVDAGVQRLREIQETQRRAFEEKGIPYPSSEEDLEQTYREGMERIRVANEETPVVEDRHSASSVSVENGIHLVRCSALTSWRAVHITDIGIGDNWGRSGAK